MGASPRQRTGRMQQQAQHPYVRDNPIATAQRARAKRRWPLYIAAYVAVGSLAAICKTALQPPIADKGANTLLVIAHPDDETMFFSPAIATIAAFQASIFVLCLSTGKDLWHARGWFSRLAVATKPSRTGPRQLLRTCGSLRQLTWHGVARRQCVRGGQQAV